LLKEKAVKAVDALRPSEGQGVVMIRGFDAGDNAVKPGGCISTASFFETNGLGGALQSSYHISV